MSQRANNFGQAVLILAILAVIWITPAGQRSLAVGTLSPQSVDIPIKWDDLGQKLVQSGVLDLQKFTALYEKQGGVPPEIQELLTTDYKGKITMTPRNAHYYLNIFWAIGLGNKNRILENGPMMDPKYGGAKNFASTGGWTIAKDAAMNHYSEHDLVRLSARQQKMVENIAQNIYRPCCNNSTYFPDCNHGMAMLGLLELLAANGVSERGIYETALAVNALWFPDTYSTIARYLDLKGLNPEKIGPKEILGPNYSSYTGYSRILKEVPPDPAQGGASCGV